MGIPPLEFKIMFEAAVIENCWWQRALGNTDATALAPRCDTLGRVGCRAELLMARVVQYESAGRVVLRKRIYIYIYIYICTHTYTYIHSYIHTYT